MTGNVDSAKRRSCAWQRWAARSFFPIPLQKAGLLDTLGIAHEEAMRAMQLVTTEGAIFSGVEAVVQACGGGRCLGGSCGCTTYPAVVRSRIWAIA